MKEQEIRSLYEAYQKVYETPEVSEESDLQEGEKPFPYEKVTAQQKKHTAAGRYGNMMKMGLAKRRAKEADKKGGSQQDAGKGWYHAKEEVDLFDIILEYLVAEGYADTNENALVIMANMSEEWRQSIVESIDLQEKLKPGTKGKISFATGKQGFDQKMTEKNPKTGRQRATSPELKAMGAHGRAKSAQYDAENRGDTEAAEKNKKRRDRIAHVVYNKTNRIIDRADND